MQLELCSDILICTFTDQSGSVPINQDSAFWTDQTVRIQSSHLHNNGPIRNKGRITFLYKPASPSSQPCTLSVSIEKCIKAEAAALELNSLSQADSHMNCITAELFSLNKVVSCFFKLEKPGGIELVAATFSWHVPIFFPFTSLLSSSPKGIIRNSPYWQKSRTQGILRSFITVFFTQAWRLFKNSLL